jgi:hypothetical protein
LYDYAMSIQSSVIDIEPSVSMTLTAILNPEQNGELCQGGTPQFEVEFGGVTVPSGTPFTITDTTTGKQYDYTTPDAAQLAIVYWGNALNADCLFGGCLGGCSYTFQATSSLSYLGPSNKVTVTINCNCSA